VISTRQKLGADWVALAEIVAAAETLAGHLSCGLSVPGRIAQLRERVARECERVAAEKADTWGRERMRLRRIA
jgi:hypothetical protein